MSPDQILEVLKKGNADHVLGLIKTHNFAERRAETITNGQHPRATILSCSDSRVPLEHIFQQGLGDLFVIRVAGNVANIDEIATAEYGTHHLHTPLLIVMGHSHCGAVTAVASGAALEGHLPSLLAPIIPVVAKVKTAFGGLPLEELVAKSAVANVFQALEDLLAKSAAIRELVSAGQVKALGAFYHLNSGQVEWLGEHPRQAALLQNKRA